MKILGRNIGVVPLAADYATYRLMVASNPRLIKDSTVDRLRAFVAAGRVLVLNYRAAPQNGDNSMRTLAPGPFAEMAEVQSEAILDLFEYNSRAGNLDAGLEAALGTQFHCAGSIFKPRTAIESITLRGAEAIADVRLGGSLNGRPAVTRTRHGKGWVFYAGCDSTDDSFYDTLARMTGVAASLKPLIAAPYGVEVTSRQDPELTYYFLLNLTETAHQKIELPHPMDDLIGGRSSVTKSRWGRSTSPFWHRGAGEGRNEQANVP